MGKWHRNGFPNNSDAARDPLRAGFSGFTGTLSNPSLSHVVTTNGKSAEAVASELAQLVRNGLRT